MNSFKITIQRKTDGHWPLVVEQGATDTSLEVRTEGVLDLDLLTLSAQVTPRDYGTMLGQALFRDQVHDAFIRARAQSEDRLSVQLFMETPELRSLRWERLCAPLDGRWNFLLLDQRAPLTLALPSQADRRFPPIRREDLRALVVVASPQGLQRYQLSPFDVEATISMVRSALGQIPCDVLSNIADAVGPPTLDALCEHLTTTPYTLLHIVCHGKYLSDLDDTVIYLAHEDQQVDPIVGSRLLDRLAQLRGERGLPHFAFLCTCESASPQAEGALGGLAQRLVRELGLPAVLAMTEPVSITTAQSLADQFYHRLYAHGHLDVALAEACAGLAERPDSTVAALYSRLGARPLFEQQIISSTSPHQQPLSLTQQQQKRNRARMLERVQGIWISGVLEPSLHGTAPIALELQKQPSAIITPWWLVLHEFDQSGPLLPADARIGQVYDHADGEVLILGEPGAGKTTLLLELTRDLLERACQDESHPMPVVFNLSSWATTRHPLAEWLVAELHTKYQIPRPLASSWIATDQVLPLLDGLDEVTAVHRGACVEAINAYRQAHGLLPTVVCSRQADYQALSTRLLLRTAVVVQPLTEQQIEMYLTSGGDQLAALRRALHEDANLQTLASTPLMLNVLTTAYQGTARQEITATGSLETKQEQVFAAYVQRMLTRRSAGAHYAREQTVHWLACLARQMKQHSQAVFYLERMQADWLPQSRLHRIYEMLFPRLVGILVGILTSLLVNMILFSPSMNPALFGGLIGGLVSGNRPMHFQLGAFLRSWKSKWRQLLCLGMCTGLFTSIIAWIQADPDTYLYDRLFLSGTVIITGLGSMLLSILVEAGKTHTAGMSNQGQHRFASTDHRRLAVLIGLLIGLIDGLPLGLGLHIGSSIGPPDGLVYGLQDELSFGITGLLLSVWLLRRGNTVEPTEIVVWSLKRFGRSLISRRHLGNTLSIVLLVVLLVGLSLGQYFVRHNGFGLYEGLYRGRKVSLPQGLSAGLTYWILFGLWNGISRDVLDDKQRIMPNEGMIRSARNGLFVGLIAGGLSILIGSVLGQMLFSIMLGDMQFDAVPDYLLQTISNNSVWITGVSCGLLAGLLTGGLAWLQHYTLRFLLWRARTIPWNYAGFLNGAAECILLRKVGGGYIFLHRLLLDYFAALETQPVSHESTENREETARPVEASLAPTGPTAPMLLEYPRLLPCGHELRSSERFCGVCGAPVPPPPSK